MSSARFYPGALSDPVGRVTVAFARREYGNSSNLKVKPAEIQLIPGTAAAQEAVGQIVHAASQDAAYHERVVSTLEAWLESNAAQGLS